MRIFVSVLSMNAKKSLKVGVIESRPQNASKQWTSRLAPYLLFLKDSLLFPN